MGVQNRKIRRKRKRKNKARKRKEIKILDAEETRNVVRNVVQVRRVNVGKKQVKREDNILDLQHEDDLDVEVEREYEYKARKGILKYVRPIVFEAMLADNHTDVMLLMH